MKPEAHETTALMRHLVHMQQAGLPWLLSLQLWRDGCRPGPARQRAQTLMDSMAAGLSLTEALARSGWSDEMLLALSRAGEAGGIWAQEISAWLSHEEHQAQLRRNWRSAWIYPVVVLGISGVVVTGILMEVLPVFESLYQNLQTPLPWATRALLMLRDALTQAWRVVPIAGLSTALAWRWVRQDPRVRWQLACAGLRWPALGRWRQVQAQALWCGLLGRLLHAGLDWSSALTLLVRAMSHRVYAQATSAVAQRVALGQALADAMAEVNQLLWPALRRPVFEPMLVHLVRAGESSGTLPDMLQQWSSAQEQWWVAAWTAALRWMEPLMMAGLGLVIGALVLALYLPMMQMGAAL